MNLKEKIDENIRILQYLSERIKRNQYIVDEKEPDQVELNVLRRFLEQYKNLSDETVKILQDYFIQEKEQGNVVSFAYKFLDKKLRA